MGLPGILAHAPLPLLVLALVVGGLGVPLPEDVVLLTAGALAHASKPGWPVVVPVCIGGVLLGDTLLFLAARRTGTTAYERGWLARLLPGPRRAKLERLFARYGGALVVVARHVAGLRAPVFALASIHGMPLRRFLLWDGLGACVSVPLMVLLGYAFANHLERVRMGVARLEHWVLALAGIALAAYAIGSGLRRLR